MVLLVGLCEGALAGGIRSAVPSAGFFNPTLGQSVVFEVNTEDAGEVSLVIVDRDGYRVRQLASQSVPSPAVVRFRWDGRGDDGRVVADEAYSPRVTLRHRERESIYFPASEETAQMLTLNPQSYDRRNGVLRYTLPVAARVHVQAGSARVDARNGTTDGPVLKTVVNRAPRPAGSVVDIWNGFDESGTIYVPDLPNFVIAIAATPLPKDAVITTGNRLERFLDTLVRRRGPSLIPRHPPSHHHAGLTAEEDVSPRLISTPRGAVWLADDRIWVTTNGIVDVDLELTGPNAARFGLQRARVMVFVDQHKVAEALATAPMNRITVPLSRSSRDSVVAINWVTEHGPVAVAAFKIRRSPPRGRS